MKLPRDVSGVALARALETVGYRVTRQTGSHWPAAKARLVLAALLRIGWSVKRSSGSHRVLGREGWPDFGSASTRHRVA